MTLRCLFGHDWIEGKLPTQANVFAKTKARPLTNRVCFRFGKKQMRAKDAAEKRAQRNKLREELDV